MMPVPVPFLPRLRRLAWLTAAALASCPAAHASDAPPAADSGTLSLPSVSVTARRSNELAKDLPFSVSVIGGDTVEQRRLLNLDDALRTLPGVDINSWGGFNDANVRIRGVGSLYQVSAEDSSVVMSVDGVPLSSRGASLATMDIERIEVLKGPQGTLFGRNSEAGAINITTRRPGRTPEGLLRGEMGQDGQYLTEAAVGGPLSASVSARVALRGAGADSQVINVQDGRPVLKARDAGARLSVLWQPASATSLLLVAERQRQRGKVGMMLLRPYAEPPTIDLAPGGFYAHNTVTRHSVEINHDLAASRLTSLTSYVRSDMDQRSGADLRMAREVYGLPMEYFKTDRASDDLIQQDLRWSSLPGARVFWVAGANLLKSLRGADMHDEVSGSLALRRFDTRANAVYGEATYPLAAALKLTAGLRHAYERKSYAATFSGAGPAGSDARSLRDSYSTGRVALSWAATPSTNLYAVAARGYKSGGFNDSSSNVADGTPYKAASAHTLELGFKMEDAARRLALNGAIFSNQVRDDHMMGYDYATFATTALNTDTRSRGAELEGVWRIARAWTVTGGVNFTDGEITRGVAGVSGGDVSAGNRLPDIARWSGALSLAHRLPLASFWGLAAPSVRTLLSYRYTGRRANDPQNHFELGSYQKLDLRVSLAAGNGEVYVWADNLLDRRHELYGYYFTPTASAGMPARGRSIGAGASWHF
ncbi:TonB-dependent receptor [Janthinobacterium sp. NFX145]|uniref:TonB-dependent receptor n=1 Tax=Janthinobacterium sp. NFX145 TaxID=3415602 RepID=UPI003CC5F17D